MGKVLQVYGSCYYNSSSNISGDDLRQIFMMPGSRMTSFGFNIIPIKGGLSKMEKQLIISVGREFGSGGHEVAQKLADDYGIALYDHDLLKEIAAKKNLKSEDLEAYDELKWNRFLYRTVRGLNSSPEQNVANLQFDFLKEKAKSGESFVVVGRCSETILRE